MASGHRASRRYTAGLTPIRGSGVEATGRALEVFYSFAAIVEQGGVDPLGPGERYNKVMGVIARLDEDGVAHTRLNCERRVLLREVNVPENPLGVARLGHVYQVAIDAEGPSQLIAGVLALGGRLGGDVAGLRDNDILPVGGRFDGVAHDVSLMSQADDGDRFVGGRSRLRIDPETSLRPAEVCLAEVCLAEV